MGRYALALVLTAVIVISPSPAFALGADYSKDQLKSHAGKFGGQTAIHGYWVNWEDVFFYAGDAKAFNQFVEAYSKFQLVKLEVVIHRGTTHASSPWDKEKPGTPADWSLYIWNTGHNLEAKTNGEKLRDGVPPGRPAPTRLDVWVGERLKLKDLRIPAGLEVVAGKEADASGEIAEFIGLRKPQPKKEQSVVAPAKTNEPFGLRVELSDGSRLVGQADLKDISLQTGFGKAMIPLTQVESIRFTEDNKTAAVRFHNGDLLTGALTTTDWDELKLRTAVGEIKVPLRLLRLCKIEAAPPRAMVVAARAVSSWEKCLPEIAFDGRRDTYWNSGDYAPGWIEADLGAPQPLADIVLIPAQDIPGPTTHEVWLSNQPIGDNRAKAKFIHTFAGDTKNEQPLKFEFAKEQSARYVQIRTTRSPTWIAWWEIEIRVNNREQTPTAPPKPEPAPKEKPVGTPMPAKDTLRSGSKF